jgi:hypothetical protein
VGVRPAAAIGESLAHEVAHLGTLDAGHPIDADTNADAAGHAPNQPGVDGNDNLMAPGRRRTGTRLTDAQKNKIAQDKILSTRGKSLSQATPFTPGERAPQQYGSAVDGVEDELGFAASDLIGVELVSTTTEPDLACALTVGQVPATGPMDVAYRLLFDADADPETGFVVGGVSGVDREVRLELHREAGAGPVATAGVLLDHRAETTAPLPAAPEVLGVAVLADPLGATEAAATPDPVFHQVRCRIPKASLALEADEVPVSVLAADAGGTRDTAALVFDRTRWQKDADLRLFQGAAVPGETLEFELSRLTPGAPFEILVNDAPVLSGVAGPAGGATGSIALPTSVPNGTFAFFVRARDATGEAALNVVNNAAPTLALELDSHLARHGDEETVDLSVANLGPERMVDLYMGVIPPPAAGPALGCPGGDPVVFLGDGFSGALLTCFSAPVQTFPPLVRSARLPGALPKTDLPGVFRFGWIPGLPIGQCIVFVALTPAGAAAGGSPSVLAKSFDTVQLTADPPLP